jgi:hypothetical protein
MKKQYFIFGDIVSKMYYDEDFDTVAKAIEGGEEHYLFSFDPEEMTGSTLLSIYDGWNGFAEIQRDEYETLSAIQTPKD